MAKENRTVIAVTSNDGCIEVMANGSISEIMSALEHTVATVFCQMSGQYYEATLYRFLELHCKSIKDLVEVGYDDGD